MLRVGVSLRSGILPLPVRGLTSARTSTPGPGPGPSPSPSPGPGPGPGPGPSAGLLTACCHMLPVRTLSGLRTLSGPGTLSGFRTLSGPGNLSGFRTLSGPGTLLGVRRFSGRGGPGVDGAVGVSSVPDVGVSGLSDSAPVHLCEDFLVGVQQASGLPWWLSIVMATLCFRSLVTLPLAAYQMVIISKVEALQTEIAALAKQLHYEVSVRASQRGWTQNQCRVQFRKNLRRLVSQLYIRDNCHPFKASVLVWVQVPLWISLSMALRNLSLGLGPAGLQSDLASGGTLWFQDLTTPDGTWILPVCMGLTNLFIIEVFTLQRMNPSRFQKILTNVFRVFSVVMIPVAAAVPSSMALYWFSSSLVGLSHNLILRSPLIHKVLRLKTPKSRTPYRDLLEAFRSKYF